MIAIDAKRELGRRSSVGARRTRLFEELRARGFEPETLDDGVTVLHNCPFHQLAQQHTELICGMNLCLLDSLLAELDGAGLRAELEPEDGYCCVRFHPGVVGSESSDRRSEPSEVGREVGVRAGREQDAEHEEQHAGDAFDGRPGAPEALGDRRATTRPRAQRAGTARRCRRRTRGAAPRRGPLARSAPRP